MATRIGVSQKTGWFLNHRIRTMLAGEQPELLDGVVEADEAFFGGKNKNRHADKKVSGEDARGRTDKTAVLGLLQRDGLVKTFVIPNCHKETIQGIMVEHVAKEAILITDAYAAYNGIDSHCSEHIRIKHTQGYYVTEGEKHTNNIEGFWSIFKRGIIGIYHYASPQHLHRYCAEFTERYNKREVSNIDRFLSVVKASNIDRIRYRDLTTEAQA